MTEMYPRKFKLSYFEPVLKLKIVTHGITSELMNELDKVLTMAHMWGVPVRIDWAPDCETCKHWDGDIDGNCPHSAAIGECEYEKTDV